MEVFRTLQGEGVLVGTPAVFVRFAACNLWSGRDEDRERDAVRHDAKCPRWCDTDFIPRASMTHDALVRDIVAQGTAGDGRRIPLVVFTGGEPLLQLNAALAADVKRGIPGVKLAVETNGTIAIDDALAAQLDHVCVSPKVEPARLRQRRGTELKVVFPAFNPADYLSIADGFDHLLVSPEASTSAVGQSLVVRDVERAAAVYCIENPRWRLSLQTHKHLGLR